MTSGHAGRGSIWCAMRPRCHPGLVTYEPGHPVNAKIGQSVKFVVTNPQGMRSSTWVVKAGSNSRDVYIGTADSMGEVKLSCHVSGHWQLAFTREHADAEGIDDRVMATFPPSSSELRPGWTHVATVMIPASSLRKPVVGEAQLPSEKISQWTAREGHAFQFKVIVGTPAADRDAGHTGIGAAGYLQVRDGSAVVVVVDEIPLSPAMEGGLLRERVKMRRLAAAQDPRNLYPSMVHSFTRFGTEPGTDAVLQIDYGDAPPWWPMVEGNP